MKRLSKSTRVSGPELLKLLCYPHLYTDYNHIGDFRVPLTSYSTAKLAKSSGVSSPGEANEISGFVIADLYHVASCCICILAAIVVVNLIVLHTRKYDSDIVYT